MNEFGKEMSLSEVQEYVGKISTRSDGVSVDAYTNSANTAVEKSSIIAAKMSPPTPTSASPNVLPKENQVSTCIETCDRDKQHDINYVKPTITESEKKKGSLSPKEQKERNAVLNYARDFKYQFPLAPKVLKPNLKRESLIPKLTKLYFSDIKRYIPKYSQLVHKFDTSIVQKCRLDKAILFKILVPKAKRLRFGALEEANVKIRTMVPIIKRLTLHEMLDATNYCTKLNEMLGSTSVSSQNILIEPKSVPESTNVPSHNKTQLNAERNGHKRRRDILEKDFHVQWQLRKRHKSGTTNSNSLMVKVPQAFDIIKDAANAQIPPFPPNRRTNLPDDGVQSNPSTNNTESQPSHDSTLANMEDDHNKADSDSNRVGDTINITPVKVHNIFDLIKDTCAQILPFSPNCQTSRPEDEGQSKTSENNTESQSSHHSTLPNTEDVHNNADSDGDRIDDAIHTMPWQKAIIDSYLTTLLNGKNDSGEGGMDSGISVFHDISGHIMRIISENNFREIILENVTNVKAEPILMLDIELDWISYVFD